MVTKLTLVKELPKIEGIYLELLHIKETEEVETSLVRVVMSQEEHHVEWFIETLGYGAVADDVFDFDSYDPLEMLKDKGEVIYSYLCPHFLTESKGKEYQDFISENEL